MVAVGLLPRLRQVAIMGSSGDLATEKQLALARKLGNAIAKRGLTLVAGGDDGVMGAAVEAAKMGGGTTLAILPQGKEIGADWLFDAVINTGLAWVQFSDVIIRSCCGAIVIGGGAGTLAELGMLYLHSSPAAFLGSVEDLAQRYAGRPLDDRNITSFPAFDDPDHALDYVISAFADVMNLDAEQLAAAGGELHSQSYPFGARSDYLPAAIRFHQSAVVRSALADTQGWLSAMAQRLDAAGDYFYYQAERYLHAATLYAQALEYVERQSDGASTEGRAFAAYLRAIALESIAFGLSGIGEARLAQIVAEVAASRYEGAIDISPPDERAYFLHSAAGLRGDAHYFEAIACLRAGDTDVAYHALHLARAAYDEALQHLPTWGQDVSSDSYQHALDRLAELEARIGSS